MQFKYTPNAWLTGYYWAGSNDVEETSSVLVVNPVDRDIIENTFPVLVDTDDRTIEKGDEETSEDLLPKEKGQTDNGIALLF